jgi:hypothetical protein
MTKRELLLAKMCEVFEENNKFYSVEYSMDKALELAENFLLKAQLPGEDLETVTYGHRALTGPHESAMAVILPFIHNWLRNDVPIHLRTTITATDCEKLAIRLSLLMRGM